MIINFYKYQGTGNDFIIIDSRKINLDLTENNIKNIANRKFGIGSDGVIIIRNHPDYHFEMQFYNPDGSQSFCGNGSRCAVLFSFHMGICPRECTFLSTDGIHSGEVIDDLNVKINIVGPVKLTKLSSGDFELNTGSPHYIKFVDDLKMEDFIVKSRIIRNNANYINSGINVNFVSSEANGIAMRTYERGVEDETLSCGSGVTAAAMAFGFKNNIDLGNLNVSTKGGDLKVEYNRNNDVFENIFLTGAVKFVYRGEIDL
jgi:diaminopimelate epimerase